MTEKIICAGFGGQGIVFLGRIIALSAMKAGKNVTFMPSYGAEMRGGTAHSMVIISTDEVPSPMITDADICVAMNAPSMDKFQSRIKKGGLLIWNSSLIDSKPKRKDIKNLAVPMTDIASGLGDVRAANIVAFGAYIKNNKVVPEKSAQGALMETFGGKKDLFEINKRAFDRGKGF